MHLQKTFKIATVFYSKFINVKPSKFHLYFTQNLMLNICLNKI